MKSYDIILNVNRETDVILTGLAKRLNLGENALDIRLLVNSGLLLEYLIDHYKDRFLMDLDSFTLAELEEEERL